MDLTFDPLFRIPLSTGLAAALLLPLLGVLLRLYDEWLSVLGLAFLAGATGVAGLTLGVPLILGAPVGGLAGALVQHLWETRGDTLFAFMIFIGWAAATLIDLNLSPATNLGPGLMDGRVLLANQMDLGAALAVAVIGVLTLPRLSQHLLHAHLFPGQARANALPVRHWRLAFEVLVALQVAVATVTLGILGTFALTIIPAWIAFRIAPSWHWTLVVSTTVGGLSYLAAFALAIDLQQPFGPLLVALLLLAAGAAALATSAKP